MIFQKFSNFIKVIQRKIHLSIKKKMFNKIKLNFIVYNNNVLKFINYEKF